jgi:hypothetical protein
MQALLVIALLVAAEGLSFRECLLVVYCDRGYVACPSCFPSCRGQGFTGVPVCNDPSFTGAWFDGCALPNDDLDHYRV